MICFDNKAGCIELTSHYHINLFCQKKIFLSILGWLLCILILHWRITWLALWHISRGSILLWWHISRGSILLRWHISRNSILLWWHISRSSRLTVLLGWNKTRLRYTILSLWHIWVWINSPWLSV